LRIVSYNVHRRLDDQAALASVVRELDPDVLVVQEGPRRFRWRTKAADLAHRLGLILAEGGQPSLGNLIMTNFRVRPYQTRSLRFPLTPGRHMRGAAFATCRVPDGQGGQVEFVVAGSHLSTDPQERPSQAALLKAELANLPAPVVFAADLNEEPDGSAWKMIAAGLVDAAGSDARPTFSANSPRRRIDAIFVDPRIAVRAYDVVDSQASRLASDHFPIVADVELPKPRG
jgi:endonuclease/exonuclease/phosphatase family metal-dependent hydrolase